MLVIKALAQAYNFLFRELRDPRADDYFLMDWVLYPILILFLYLKFVLQWGPRWMKNRQPYQLDTVLKVYNIFQISVNLYMCYVAVRYTYFFGSYSFICEPVDYSRSEIAYRIFNGGYLYFLMKVADLLDTVFFVLRKKTNQISFLHVYHHGGMVILSWTAVKFLCGGQSAFVGAINSFIHTVMYTYYFLAASYPGNSKLNWWKKYLTQLQICQFALIALNWVALSASSDCGYPKWVGYVMIPQNFFVTTLFVDFYIKAYLRKKPTKVEKTQ